MTLPDDPHVAESCDTGSSNREPRRATGSEQFRKASVQPDVSGPVMFHAVVNDAAPVAMKAGSNDRLWPGGDGLGALAHSVPV